MRSRPSHPQTVAAAPPITPTFAWYDPSNLSTITASGGNVSQLNDLSGNAHHLTASGSDQPTTGAATIGGLNALLFGSSKQLVCAGVIQAQPLTIFAVIQVLTITGSQQQFIASDANVFLTNAGGGSLWSYEAGATVHSAVAADLNRHVIGAIFNGASSSLDLDGVQIAAGNPGTAGIIGTRSLRLNDGGAANDGLSGSFGEVMYFSSALSSGDRAATFNYLRAKWGTT